MENDRTNRVCNVRVNEDLITCRSQREKHGTVTFNVSADVLQPTAKTFCSLQTIFTHGQ